MMEVLVFFYDENQQYNSPALSKQSPVSDNFHSPGSVGYNTATDTPSPQNLMIAESV